MLNCMLHLPPGYDLKIRCHYRPFFGLILGPTHRDEWQGRFQFTAWFSTFAGLPHVFLHCRGIPLDQVAMPIVGIRNGQ